MSRRYTIAAFLILLLLTATAGSGQTTARRLTTVDALRQFPGYYHLQNVLLRGEFVETGPEIAFRASDHDMRVQLADGVTTTSGNVEIRATLVDVGRLEPGDPRAGSSTATRDQERWPRPGEELFLQVTAVTAAQPAATPSIRAIALEPWKFEGQRVTLVGQFRARNVMGDLPASPARSRYDFVLRSADAAIWVTGVRPRLGNAELEVDGRRDTGRWVEVSGVVARQRGLVMVEGATFVQAQAPDAPEVEEETVERAAAAPPLEVVFSSPTADDIDVPPTASVRVQFSRGLTAASLTDQVRASYVGAPADAPPLKLQTSYDAATRSIQVRFAEPLERFRTVRVELLDGIRAFDGGVFAGWSISFSVGG